MHKKISSILAILIFLTTLIFGQNNDQKSLAVTVYNSNLGVIKDVRAMTINSGTSKIAVTDVAQFIDPTSVHIKLNGEVVEQNYQYDLVSLDKIMKKYIDNEIQLIGDKGDLVEGKLLSSFGGQIVLEKKDGGLLMLPNVNKYQISVGSLPEGLITKPTLVWLVNSNSSGQQDIEISYQTSGMQWHAEYVAVLNEDDTKLDLNSWVSVENNSGTTYKDALLKLVAGDVHLLSKRGPYEYAVADGIMQREMAMAKGQFEEKEFFEYHIYNLQRATTLANNETKQISLFETEDVGVTKKYLYKSGGYFYGSSDGKRKVAVIVEFDNKEENNLGIPMPKGKVRVYKSDGESVEFIGEDMIDHTPKNETIKLKIGDAFDIVAEEKQIESKKISSKVYEHSYEITITNRKKENVVVEVERYLGLYWNILNSSIKYEKKDAQNIIFKVPVKADDKTTLKFKVRYTY
jgi:hypothetical protein